MKKNFAIFCADEKNNLIMALHQSGYHPTVVKDVEQAMELIEEGGSIFVLADEYPAKGTNLSQTLLDRARQKRLKLYVEYPENVLGKETKTPRTIVYERLVAPDGFFGVLEPGAILMLNGCWHRPYFEEGPGLLCLAKVAGYDKMAYGLPNEYDVVLDYLDERRDVLISTSCLSSFITGRYAPAASWKNLWQELFRQMGLGEISLQWEPTVSIVAGPKSPLLPCAGHRAWERNVDWSYTYMIGRCTPTIAVFEGFESAIDYRGRQYIRTVLRGDCIGETAMELCYGWAQNGNPDLRKVSCELVDRLFTADVFYNDNPDSSMYGLINWFENAKRFYGDDNARLLLGIMSVRELTGEKRWDEKILRCVLANLRTSGSNGLRHPAFYHDSFEQETWFDFYNREVNFVSPHYQSYLWSVFLWTYQLTGIEELLVKSKMAIAKVMELFPDKLRWQNSLTGEVTRMLLPLSFLVRIDPTEEHKNWLKRVVDATIAYQQPCGAIRDEFGDLSLGNYPPPQSNESYGTSEASLIQNNGDPATDLLYATNWAFIGLWEASLVMEEAYVKEAYEKLRDFLLRIQVCSKDHPELDGAWMRSFDYEKWEYWGSASDIGWSAWSVESGWVNAWIATTLLLEERQESLMKLSAQEDFMKIASDIYEEMMTPRQTKEVANTQSVAMPGSAE